MARNRTGSNTPWQDFNGPNLGYVHELYESYLENPESIDQEMKKLFDQWGAPALYQNKGFHIQKEQQTEDAVDIMQKAISAATLALNIRINDVRKRRQEKIRGTAWYQAWFYVLFYKGRYRHVKSLSIA